MEIKAEEMLYRLQQGKAGKDWPNVLVVYGEEDFYRSQIAAAVPEWVFAGIAAADRAITVFDKNTDLHQLAEAVNTYPFFCGRSLVVLKDERLLGRQEAASAKLQEEGLPAKKEDAGSTSQEKRLPAKKEGTPLDRLIKIFSDVPEYCTLLLCAAKLDKRTRFFKLLKEKALLCECPKLYTNQLEPWLERQAAAHGARWERGAVDMVQEYLAPVEHAPLQLLQQELEKLALYANGRTVWTRADVEEIFAALPEASAFAIADFIAEGRLEKALQQLQDDKNRRGSDILPTCAIIMFKLRQLLRFLELRRQGFAPKAAAAQLNLKPYTARLVQEQSRRFTEPALQEALLELGGLNIALRRGGRSYERLEEILVKLLS